MKTIILLSLLIFLVNLQAQTAYEVQPGTKGNQLILQLVNISEIENIENLYIRLLKTSENIKFVTREILIEGISNIEEKDALFTFDIEYHTDISKQDTIVFMITDNNSIHLTKQFVLNYVLPTEYLLEQNFPNPFNPTTTIRYALPFDSNVKILVYNILGEVVSELVNTVQGVGYHEVVLNANNLASGVYIYSIQAKSVDGGKDFSSVKKMMFLK